MLKYVIKRLILFVIVIFGNVIIIGLEGLIVSIQTIRLEYYEFFSKFFIQKGKKFIPFKIEKHKIETIDFVRFNNVKRENSMKTLLTSELLLMLHPHLHRIGREYKSTFSNLYIISSLKAKIVSNHIQKK